MRNTLVTRTPLTRRVGKRRSAVLAAVEQLLIPIKGSAAPPGKLVQHG
jgi:hypothetical protein